MALIFKRLKMSLSLPQKFKGGGKGGGISSTKQIILFDIEQERVLVKTGKVNRRPK